MFLDVYTWNWPWIQWNTVLIGDGSQFRGYFVIFFQEQGDGDSSKNVYFAHTYTWHYMLDAVVGGMFTPPAEVSFSNTISDVLCISDTLL